MALGLSPMAQVARTRTTIRSSRRSSGIQPASKQVAVEVGPWPGPTLAKIRRPSEGVVSKSFGDQLVDVHRARNGLTHDYPDVRASIIYPACQEVAKLVQPFTRSYMHWLGSIGYAVPPV